MPVNIIKSKSKPQIKAKSVDKPIDKAMAAIKLIHAIEVDIQPLLKALNPLEKSLEIAKSKLQEHCDEMYDSSSKASLQCGNILCDIGAKAKSTKVTDKEQVLEILQNLGDNVVLELVKFGITDLRKYLTPMELDKVTKTTRSGKRSIKLSLVEYE